MRCPTCGEEMELLKQDISRSKTHQEKIYTRQIYGCQKDDSWITVELPQSQSVEKPAEALAN